jgi:hypothetical protein
MPGRRPAATAAAFPNPPRAPGLPSGPPPGPPATPAPAPGSAPGAPASPAPPRPAPAPPRPQRASAPTASWDEPGPASPGPRAPVATAPPAARRSRPSPSGPERRIWNVPHPTAAIVRSSLPLRSDQPSVFIRSSRQEPWSSKKENTEWPSGFPAPGGREPGDLPLRLSARHPHNAAIRVGSAQGPRGTRFHPDLRKEVRTPAQMGLGQPRIEAPRAA